MENKKNYVVMVHGENYKMLSLYEYKYECLTDKYEEYFETFEEAKKFVDNFNLQIDYDKRSGSIYADYLAIFKFEDDEIVGDQLYDRGINVEEISKQCGVKIKFS